MAHRPPAETPARPAGADRGRIGAGDGHGWDAATRHRVETCEREAEHAYGPAGYLAWHSWAERKSRTHRQLRCVCGLYLLLEAKPPEAARGR